MINRGNVEQVLRVTPSSAEALYAVPLHRRKEFSLEADNLLAVHEGPGDPGHGPHPAPPPRYHVLGRVLPEDVVEALRGAAQASPVCDDHKMQRSPRTVGQQAVQINRHLELECFVHPAGPRFEDDGHAQCDVPGLVASITGVLKLSRY